MRGDQRASSRRGQLYPAYASAEPPSLAYPHVCDLSQLQYVKRMNIDKFGDVTLGPDTYYL